MLPGRLAATWIPRCRRTRWLHFCMLLAFGARCLTADLHPVDESGVVRAAGPVVKRTGAGLGGHRKDRVPTEGTREKELEVAHGRAQEARRRAARGPAGVLQ